MPKPERRSIRLSGFDYSQQGAYFVTICVRQRECRLGSIVAGEMRLNAIGEIARAGWGWLDQKFLSAQVDIFLRDAQSHPRDHFDHRYCKS